MSRASGGPGTPQRNKNDIPESSACDIFENKRNATIDQTDSLACEEMKAKKCAK